MSSVRVWWCVWYSRGEGNYYCYLYLMRLIQAWSSQNKNIIILDRKWSFYTTHSDVTWQTPPPELILFMSEMKTSGYLAALQRGIPFISLTNATMEDDFQFNISKEIFLTIWSFIYISSLTTTSLRKIIISSFRF